jgi:hypothetical protein
MIPPKKETKETKPITKIDRNSTYLSAISELAVVYVTTIPELQIGDVTENET